MGVRVGGTRLTPWPGATPGKRTPWSLGQMMWYVYTPRLFSFFLFCRWTGGELKDDVLVNLAEARRENSSSSATEPPCPSVSPGTPAAVPPPRGSSPQPRSGSAPTAADSPASSHGPSIYAENLLEPFAFPAHSGRSTPRTPHSITITPPSTPQAKRRHKLKPPRTPPPPCRKVFQLLPNFPALTRSKSHESQLGNRIDEVPPIK